MLEGPLPRARPGPRICRRPSKSCFLEEVEHQIIGTLSKGYRQRVGLAAAILHEPQALVLDEPTVGLDPKQIIAIRELIRELGRERTLLLSTHILPEVELLCDRVIIIDRGRIVAEGTPESLKQSWIGATLLRVELKQGSEGVAEILEQIKRRQLGGGRSMAIGRDSTSSASTRAIRAKPSSVPRSTTAGHCSSWPKSEPRWRISLCA